MAERKLQTIGPTPEEMIGRAKAMIPAIVARADEDERNAHVSDDTIREMTDAGLYRVLQPKRYGGFEMEPSVFAEIQMALGRGDLSTAWVYGIYAGHNYHLALFDERAQRDVWGENPSARIVSPYAPDGRAVPVKGGYRLSGHWKFSSGSPHSDWALLGGLTTEEKPRYLIFLLPRKDYEVVKNWNVFGLKATGSHDIEVTDAFIPDYRTHDIADIMRIRQPGHEVNDAVIYRLPHMQVLSRLLSTGVIGSLEAMLDAIVVYLRPKVNARGTAMLHDPEAHLVIGETVAAIDEMKGTLHRNFNEMMAFGREHKHPPLDDRLLHIYQCSAVTDRCVSLGRRIYETAGGNGLYDDKLPFGRIYRNMIAARQHIGVQHHSFARALGSYKLGLGTPNILF